MKRQEERTQSSNEVVLEVEGLTKRFPGVLANDDVHMKLHQGEILALLGENGAGKSTLMNMIYGLYRADEGTVRLKGREVRFASPREAIHSGIGMVHQHFQLVNVMTVAENVVLGEEADVAYHGETSPWLSKVLTYLASIVTFVLIVFAGIALGELKYLAASVVIGAAAGVVIALPPLARVLWGAAWRIALALIALWIADQVRLVTRVGLTDIALRQKVETVDVDQTEMDDGFQVNEVTTTHARIDFHWRREASEAESTEALILAAKERMEPYRDQGIPGWLLDGIDDAPPVTYAFSVALLLVAFGWHSIATWRGMPLKPGRLQSWDIAALGGLVLVYAVLAWLNLDTVSTAAQVVLFALTVAGLGWILWRTMQRRAGASDDLVISGSPVDGAIDSLLDFMHTLTQIGNLDLAARRVRELSQRYGLEVDPDAVIEKLPVGAQQRVEIIKALYRRADILILDEPTAVLTPQEGRELFKIMRELASQGVSIIFITHKLKEVFEVATNIVVMRDGRVVGTTTPREATEKSLAAMMVGREVILQVEKEAARPAEQVLVVEGLNAFNDRGAQALDEVGFEVRAGEVLGVAGVQGNGQTELVEVLTGLRNATGGSVQLLGSELQPEVQPEGGRRARGLSFVLDAVLIAVLTLLVRALVEYFAEDTVAGWSTLQSVVTTLAIVVYVAGAYFLAGWSIAASTLGMSLFDLEVVTRGDQKPTLVRVNRRYATGTLLGVVALLLVVSLVFSADAATTLWNILVWIVAATLLVWFAGLIALHSQLMLYPPGDWFKQWFDLRVIRHERINSRRVKDVGTSHVPEDRRRHGMVAEYSVADNLILNDFYDRPYAKEPTAAQLPVSLLRYALLVGAVMALLTVVMLWAWDGWLWEALQDAYNVPDYLRGVGWDDLSRADRNVANEAFKMPYMLSVLLVMAAELLFGLVGHLVASRILGLKPVEDATQDIDQAIRTTFWRIRGHDGEPPAPVGGLLRDETAIEKHARQLIAQFDIRTPSPATSGGSLSGGNQQKMIVAREFSRKPRLLIASQPTRGIDVGSIEFIHQQIIEQRDAGAAVLLVSAELDEIMALSDRIAVMYKGQIIDTLPAEQATREQLGLLMAGIHDAPTPARDSGRGRRAAAPDAAPVTANPLAADQGESGLPRNNVLLVVLAAFSLGASLGTGLFRYGDRLLARVRNVRLRK